MTHKKQYEEHAEKLKGTELPTDVPSSGLLFGAMKPTSRAEIMSSFPSKYTTDMLIARYFNCNDPATRMYSLFGLFKRAANLRGRFFTWSRFSSAGKKTSPDCYKA